MNLKSVKMKLMSAVAMLTVATVMMAGTSYAWFTLSTNPEVKGMTANLAANENLEIALDNGYTDAVAVDKASRYGGASGNLTDPQGSTTGNPYTWGNLVDLGYAFGTSGINGNLILAPVKYENGALKYPQYGTDGRVEELGNLTAVKISDLAGVTGDNLKGGVAVYQKTGSTLYDAVSATYWLRSNEACNVDLTATGVKRAGSTNDTQTGETDVNTAKGLGSYIQATAASENSDAQIAKYLKNLRIRFDVGNTSYYAVPKTRNATGEFTATDSKYELGLYSDAAGTNAAKIALTANTAVKVTMYVYIDGETMTNADALLDDLTNMGINIQFASDQTTTPGAMDGATKTN